MCFLDVIKCKKILAEGGSKGCISQNWRSSPNTARHQYWCNIILKIFHKIFPINFIVLDIKVLKSWSFVHQFLDDTHIVYKFCVHIIWFVKIISFIVRFKYICQDFCCFYVQICHIREVFVIFLHVFVLVNGLLDKYGVHNFLYMLTDLIVLLTIWVIEHGSV